MRVFIILMFVTVFSDCSPKLAPDAGWARQQWTVVEMKGVPVQQSGVGEMHILYLKLPTGNSEVMADAIRSVAVIL